MTATIPRALVAEALGIDEANLPPGDLPLDRLAARFLAYLRAGEDDDPAPRRPPRRLDVRRSTTNSPRRIPPSALPPPTPPSPPAEAPQDVAADRRRPARRPDRASWRRADRRDRNAGRARPPLCLCAHRGLAAGRGRHLALGPDRGRAPRCARARRGRPPAPGLRVLIPFSRRKHPAGVRRCGPPAARMQRLS